MVKANYLSKDDVKRLEVLVTLYREMPRAIPEAREWQNSYDRCQTKIEEMEQMLPSAGPSLGARLQETIQSRYRIKQTMESLIEDELPGLKGFYIDELVHLLEKKVSRFERKGRENPRIMNKMKRRIKRHLSWIDIIKARADDMVCADFADFDEKYMISRNSLIENWIHFAKGIAYRMNVAGMSKEERESTAYYALVESSERYTIAGGAGYSTLAGKYIRHYIAAESKNRDQIRIPLYLKELFPKIRRLLMKGIADAGRIGGELGVKPRTITRAIYAMGIQNGMNSLDSDLGAEKTYHSMVADPFQSDPETIFARKGVNGLVNDYINRVLDEREAVVIKTYELDESTTLEQTGEKIGRTRERVRQLVSSGKKKIKEAIEGSRMQNTVLEIIANS